MQCGLSGAQSGARSPVRPNCSHAVHHMVKSRGTFKCQLPLEINSLGSNSSSRFNQFQRCSA